MNIVTRDTHSPNNRERLARWFERSANLRAAASTGCDVSMSTAPNVVPIRPNLGKVETISEAAITYCRPRGYQRWIEKEFVTVALWRVRHGASMATAIQSAKVRADFLKQVGKAGSTDGDAA